MINWLPLATLGTVTFQPDEPFLVWDGEMEWPVLFQWEEGMLLHVDYTHFAVLSSPSGAVISPADKGTACQTDLPGLLPD
jgi:hypothetical protein